MVYGSGGCTGSIVPVSASGEGLKKLKIKAEGEGGAGESHGKSWSKTEGEGPRLLNNQISCGLAHRQGNGAKPFMRDPPPRSRQPPTRPQLQHWGLQFNARFGGDR